MEIEASCSDLIIVCHTKDLYKIPFLIENWEQNIIENIERKILITNDVNSITNEITNLVDMIICDDDLKEVVEFKKILEDHPKKAWYTQQIIKIAAKSLSKKYIIIDSDTCLRKKHGFFINDIPIVRITHESGLRYLNFEIFIGLKCDYRSFIPHMGSFTLKTLTGYCSLIEEQTGVAWYITIAKYILSNLGYFSEWNSYNKYLLQVHNAEIFYWFNKSESGDIKGFDPNSFRYYFRDSISFHEPHKKS